MLLERVDRPSIEPGRFFSLNCKFLLQRVAKGQVDQILFMVIADKVLQQVDLMLDVLHVFVVKIHHVLLFFLGVMVDHQHVVDSALGWSVLDQKFIVKLAETRNGIFLRARVVAEMAPERQPIGFWPQK
jgi:hypothetical protein